MIDAAISGMEVNSFEVAIMYEEAMILWFDNPADLIEHVIAEAERIRDKEVLTHGEMVELEERICSFRAAKVY